MKVALYSESTAAYNCFNVCAILFKVQCLADEKRNCTVQFLKKDFLKNFFENETDINSSFVLLMQSRSLL